jgi:hypothetical protein
MIRNVLSSNRSRGIKIDEFTKDIKYDDDVLNWYYKNLLITIHKLNIDASSIEYIYIRNMKKLHLLIMQNKQIENEWKKYKLLYKEWHVILSRYSGKLNNFILDDSLYMEVIQFIKDEISDKDELNIVLDFYKDKTNFDEFIANNDKRIRSIYDNPLNPIIWLIRFKDMKTLYYKYLKPIKPIIKPVKNLYSIFSNHISNIKAHLLKNSEINFYLIKISITYLINSYLEYRDTIASE